MDAPEQDRKSTRLNSSHMSISYAVFCLKKKKKNVQILNFHRKKSKTYKSVMSTKEQLHRTLQGMLDYKQLFCCPVLSVFFFFNDTATTEIYTLSLHDALPI